LSLSLFLCLFSCSISTYDGNYALSFDGVDDVVIVGHVATDLQLLDFWTLEAWIKPFSSNAAMFQPNIVGFPKRHPNLELCGRSSQCNDSTGMLTQLREEGGQYHTIVGNPKVTDERWYHVAGSWNNDTLYLYVDGEIDGVQQPYRRGYQNPMVCEFPNCEEGIQIGGYRCCQTYSNQYFKGFIDEVRIWNIGRTQAEIKNTMSSTLTGAEPGLLYYWRFDEGSKSLVDSLAADAYGTLGGGIVSAEPRWVQSDAPLVNVDMAKPASAQPLVVEVSNTIALALIVGAVVSGISLLIGTAIGGLVVWKIMKRGSSPSSSPKKWELQSFLRDG